MFFFGKKKKEKKQEQAVPVVNKEELIAKASEKVTELESKTGDERVSLLNEIVFAAAAGTDKCGNGVVCDLHIYILQCVVLSIMEI